MTTPEVVALGIKPGDDIVWTSSLGGSHTSEGTVFEVKNGGARIYVENLRPPIKSFNGRVYTKCVVEGDNNPQCIVSIQVKLPVFCQCGSFKALGIGRGHPGHSPWCPWSQP